MGAVHVGLVTHPRSRFDADGTATRQAQDLADARGRRGAGAGLLISDRDDYDAQALPLGRAELRRSARYQADLEYRWRRYLASAGGRPARAGGLDRVLGLAMAGKRQVRTEALWPWSDGAAGRTAATRLLNIDLSHLRALDAGVASGADWVLVLEDDARVDDVEAAVDDVLAAVAAVEGTPVAFVSVSESIPLAELGVDGIVGGRLSASAPSWLVATTTPVTNTVCANLYRSSFAADLAAGIRARGLLPVAPIDWRLNEQVMAMVADGRLGPSSCAWALPGLFLQASMHPA